MGMKLTSHSQPSDTVVKNGWSCTFTPVSFCGVYLEYFTFCLFNTLKMVQIDDNKLYDMLYFRR